MSHFSVVVIGPDVDEQLAPYHEFECTGSDDEYVQTIDRTEEAWKAYGRSTVERLKLADGTVTDLYDPDGHFLPQYLFDPTPEDLELTKKASIFNPAPDAEVREARQKAPRWNSERTKVLRLPAGAEAIRVKAEGEESFAEWASDYFGGPVIPHGMKPNLKKDAKYGYVQLGPSMDPMGDDVRVFDRTNPNKKWDWYQIGGRWTGFFRLKPQTSGALGEPGIQRLDPDYTPPPAGRADIVMKSDVDWEGMRAEAAYDAGERYDKVHAVLVQHPTPLSWKQVLKKYEDAIDPNAPEAPEDVEVDRATIPEVGITIIAAKPTQKNFVELARKEYWDQPAVKALQGPALREVVGFFFDLEDYQMSREEHIRRARASAICPFAIVKDGKWFEKGEMGWWGIVTDEKEETDWALEVEKLFDSLPDDTELTTVDCHI